MAATTSHKEYFDFVKSIGESKSKQEEDRIILDEVMQKPYFVFKSQFNHMSFVLW